MECSDGIQSSNTTAFRSVTFWKHGLLSEFDKRSCTLIRPLRKARFPEGTPVIYHCYKDIKQLCKLKPQLVHLKIPEGAKSWGAYQIWLTKRGAEMAEKLNAWQKENQTKPKTDPKKRKETLALNLPAQKRKKSWRSFRNG